MSIELIVDSALMSNSHDAARYLENEIERRGLQEEYINALLPNYHSFEPMSKAELFALLRATPAQRAMAFLSVTKAGLT